MAPDPTELARVLSHFDTGVISAITPIRRGSGGSLKWIIQCQRGVYLLKRRPIGDDPAALAFMHRVQQELQRASFPLPALIAPRSAPPNGGDASLMLDGRLYELFRFLASSRYDGSTEGAMEAGRMLARFHTILGGAFPTPPARPGQQGYHRVLRVQTELVAVGERVRLGVRGAASNLAAMYALAGDMANAAGAATWPQQLVHADWHPGNLLFDGPRIVGVIDYDALRLEPRAMDLANGALQFSLVRSDAAPDGWPPQADEARLEAFLKGYDSTPGCTISRAECDALAWLMIESLIAEAAAPIAATGSFGGVDGAAVIRMVERKAVWLRDNQPRIAKLLG